MAEGEREAKQILDEMMKRVGDKIPGLGLAMGVSPDGKHVRIDASQPFDYLDLLPQQAVALASGLRHYAEKVDARVKIGATGEFPEGKANEEDEGALEMMLRYEALSNLVELHFGKPVQFLGMQPEQMVDFGRKLIAFAEEHTKGPNP